MPGEPRPDAALLPRDAFDDVEHFLFGMDVHLLVDVCLLYTSTDCAALVRDLKDASSRGILAKRLKYYAHATLLRCV